MKSVVCQQPKIISHLNFDFNFLYDTTNTTTEEVAVITCDSRIIKGKLAGYDQLQNIILQNALERIYPILETQEDDEDHQGNLIVELVPLGLYVIRGDNVAIISDVREGVWEAEENASNLDVIKMFQSGQMIKEVHQAVFEK